MSPSADRSGLVIVVSAPSGGGKGTILNRVFGEDNRLRHTVSATTRRPRKGEVDGRHYHFVDEETFRRWIDEGRFVEWAEVHGSLYGTLHSELVRLTQEGADVVLELDVQGMRSLRRVRDDVVTIFIEPPSLEVLEERLRARGGLSEQALWTRLDNAKDEIAAKNEYDHVVINDDLDQAVADFRAILRTERAKAGLPATDFPA